MSVRWLPFTRQLIFQTLTDPRAAARRVVAFDFSYSMALATTIIVACLAMILNALGHMGRGPGPSDIVNALMSKPMLAAVVYIAVTAGIAAASVIIGRAFGGTGSHAASLSLFAWFQGMMVLLQAIELVLLLALPAMAAFFALLILAWTPWALAQFIAVLHGFRSVLKVIGLGAISLAGLTFLLAILLSATGVGVPGAS